MRYRYKPYKDGTELFAKGSSLAITVREDDKHGFKFYVWNRRTHSILSQYDISLMDHCKKSLLNVEPIKRPRK